ncbi:MAG TPA: hypothetical protein PL182_08510, partial [Pseudobdellovibrionaceae bacterium]|nr:hypothetical protein [Pseudobdellovibrionaceae bacterium]
PRRDRDQRQSRANGSSDQRRRNEGGQNRPRSSQNDSRRHQGSSRPAGAKPAPATLGGKVKSFLKRLFN